MRLKGGTQEGATVELITGGKRAYLWVGSDAAPYECYGTLSGAASLRKLARAILAEVGDA